MLPLVRSLFLVLLCTSTVTTPVLGYRMDLDAAVHDVTAQELLGTPKSITVRGHFELKKWLTFAVFGTDDAIGGYTPGGQSAFTQIRAEEYSGGDFTISAGAEDGKYEFTARIPVSKPFAFATNPAKQMTLKERVPFRVPVESRKEPVYEFNHEPAFNSLAAATLKKKGAVSFIYKTTTPGPAEGVVPPRRDRQGTTPADHDVAGPLENEEDEGVKLRYLGNVPADIDDFSKNSDHYKWWAMQRPAYSLPMCLGQVMENWRQFTTVGEADEKWGLSYSIGDDKELATSLKQNLLPFPELHPTFKYPYVAWQGPSPTYPFTVLNEAANDLHFDMPAEKMPPTCTPQVADDHPYRYASGLFQIWKGEHGKRLVSKKVLRKQIFHPHGRRTRRNIKCADMIRTILINFFIFHTTTTITR